MEMIFTDYDMWFAAAADTHFVYGFWYFTFDMHGNKRATCSYLK